MKRFLFAVVACALSVHGLHAAVVNGKVMFLTKRGQKPVVVVPDASITGAAGPVSTSVTASVANAIHAAGSTGSMK